MLHSETCLEFFLSQDEIMFFVVPKVSESYGILEKTALVRLLRRIPRVKDKDTDIRKDSRM